MATLRARQISSRSGTGRRWCCRSVWESTFAAGGRDRDRSRRNAAGPEAFRTTDLDWQGRQDVALVDLLRVRNLSLLRWRRVSRNLTVRRRNRSGVVDGTAGRDAPTVSLQRF